MLAKCLFPAQILTRDLMWKRVTTKTRRLSCIIGASIKQTEREVFNYHATTYALRLTTTVPEVTIDSLLKYLAVGVPDAEKDTKRAMSELQTRNQDTQERTRYFMDKARVKEWLTSTDTNFLLVNGHGTDKEGLSAMSSACAVLASGFYKVKGYIPLVLFCGLHHEEGENATFLLRSLISQLLRSYPWDETSILDDIFKTRAAMCDKKQIEDCELPALVSFFETLIERLPEGWRTFILVDGITHYEDEVRKKATDNFLQDLLNTIDYL